MPDKVDYTKAGAPSKWANTPFKRGAIRTPAHKLLAAPRFTPAKAPLPQIAMVPPQLSYWLNNQYGDCVTAEEAFAKAAWSVYCGLPELMIPDAEVQRWASAGGFLDGADLTSVMDAMAQSGFQVNGTTYNDGPHQTVDYSIELVLQAALCVGPVKIAIDANALPSGAGNQSGWTGLGGSPGQFPNTDHCVALCGYGPAAWLCQQLGVPLPSGVQPTTVLYLLFTWDTIGIVDEAWIMSTTTEAHVRNPTTVGQTPNPAPTPTPVPPTPTPPPTPPTPPAPPVSGDWLADLTHTLPDGTVVGHLKGTITPPAAPTPGPTPNVDGIPWAVVMDVIKLFADIRNKAGTAAIIADVQQILIDLGIKAVIQAQAKVPAAH